MAYSRFVLVLTVVAAAALTNSGVVAWGGVPSTKTTTTATTRAQFLQTAAVAASSLFLVNTNPAIAQEDTPKLLNLSNDDLKAIIQQDVVERKFLTNGKLTRAAYDEAATFTDEIDTYTLDKWVEGTQKLFVGDKSRVDLVGTIDVNADRVEFRFDEDLMFNIPFKPVVSLTGKVVLKRSPDTGLITSYQEFWDQDVATVLKSAKF
jgi:hypothetical protein